MNIEYIQCTLLMSPLHRKVNFKQVLVHTCAVTRGLNMNIEQAGAELCQAQHSLSLDLDTN